MKILGEVARILMRHDLYIDFDFKNVQFSTLHKVMFYWGSAKVDNSHRDFYQVSNSSLLNSS
jgi:hypothetical protein